MHDLVSLLFSPDTLNTGYKWSYNVHDYESVNKRTKTHKIDTVDTACMRTVREYYQELDEAATTFRSTWNYNHGLSPWEARMKKKVLDGEDFDFDEEFNKCFPRKKVT